MNEKTTFRILAMLHSLEAREDKKKIAGMSIVADTTFFSYSKKSKKSEGSFKMKTTPTKATDAGGSNVSDSKSKSKSNLL
jgi:hypothetical protein